MHAMQPGPTGEMLLRRGRKEMTREQERRQMKRYRKMLSRHEFVQDTKKGMRSFFKEEKVLPDAAPGPVFGRHHVWTAIFVFAACTPAGVTSKRPKAWGREHSARRTGFRRGHRPRRFFILAAFQAGQERNVQQGERLQKISKAFSRCSAR